jgi:hypothetical protein
MTDVSSSLKDLNPETTERIFVTLSSADFRHLKHALLHFHSFLSTEFDLSIMATAEEQATALKNEGNKAFAGHDWFAAIDFYTKAIELNAKEPTYYSNRAQVFPLLLPSQMVV